MIDSDYDYLFKIIIVGDSGIGKSAMLFRFVDDIYNTSYISTIGVDFKMKNIFINGKIIKLQIWDTAGQERFRTITTSYYRGAHIILICYSITDYDSFRNLEMWYGEIKKYASLDAKIIICGTKNDLITKREVTYEEGKAFAEKYGFYFFETSSKDNKNIDELFEKSSESMLNDFLTTMKINAEKNTQKKKVDMHKSISLQNASFITSVKNNVKKNCCV
jgi:Ras-related protein Rab-1A